MNSTPEGSGPPDTHDKPKFFSLTSPVELEQHRRKGQAATIKYMILAAIVLGAGAMGYMYVPLLPACDDPEQAYDASKDFVLRRLKSPSTASMPWNTPSDAKIVGASCNYTVTAYVDAENGFGARSRVWYVAHMEYRRDRGRWELDNLTVDPPEEILRAWRGW